MFPEAESRLEISKRLCSEAEILLEQSGELMVEAERTLQHAKMLRRNILRALDASTQI